MQFRMLGTDGPMVSILGFGAWPIGGGLGRVERNAAIDTVRATIDTGITMIDTAEGYRSSERIIGAALTGGYRERCFLASLELRKSGIGMEALNVSSVLPLESGRTLGSVLRTDAVQTARSIRCTEA